MSATANSALIFLIDDSYRPRALRVTFHRYYVSIRRRFYWDMVLVPSNAKLLNTPARYHKFVASLLRDASIEKSLGGGQYDDNSAEHGAT